MVLVGLNTLVPEVETLLEPPDHEIVARLALLDDHLRVVLPPRLIVEGVAVKELIRGAVPGVRTVTVTFFEVVRLLALVIVKR